MEIDGRPKAENVFVCCLIPLLGTGAVLAGVFRCFDAYGLVKPLVHFVVLLAVVLPFSVIAFSVLLLPLCRKKNIAYVKEQTLPLIFLLLVLISCICEIFLAKRFMPWITFYLLIASPVPLCIVAAFLEKPCEE